MWKRRETYMGSKSTLQHCYKTETKSQRLYAKEHTPNAKFDMHESIDWHKRYKAAETWLITFLQFA